MIHPKHLRVDGSSKNSRSTSCCSKSSRSHLHDEEELPLQALVLQLQEHLVQTLTLQLPHNQGLGNMVEPVHLSRGCSVAAYPSDSGLSRVEAGVL